MEEEQVLEDVTLNMEMSRGMEQESTISFDDIAHMEVSDEYGEKIKFGALHAHQKTIIIFIRVSRQSPVLTHVYFT